MSYSHEASGALRTVMYSSAMKTATIPYTPNRYMASGDLYACYGEGMSIENYGLRKESYMEKKRRQSGLGVSLVSTTIPRFA